MIAVGTLLVLVLIAVAGTVAVYNNLVRARNQFRNMYSQIDVQLRRRYDLIPNLVETAKAYLTHERETLEAVITARNTAAAACKAAAKNPGEAGVMKDLSQAEGMLSATLGRFFALSESYPDLKADQNMRQLSEELISTENRIAFARQAYNDSTMMYNNKRDVFPNNLVAGIFNFKAGEFLEATESKDQRAAPRVAF